MRIPTGGHCWRRLGQNWRWRTQGQWHAANVCQRRTPWYNDCPTTTWIWGWSRKWHGWRRSWNVAAARSLMTNGYAKTTSTHDLNVLMRVTLFCKLTDGKEIHLRLAEACRVLECFGRPDGRSMCIQARTQIHVSLKTHHGTQFHAFFSSMQT